MQLRLAHLSCVAMLGLMQVAATRPRKMARNGETFQKNQMEATFSESPKNEAGRACVSWQVTLNAKFLAPVQNLVTNDHDSRGQWNGFFPGTDGTTWVKPWILPDMLFEKRPPSWDARSKKMYVYALLTAGSQIENIAKTTRKMIETLHPEQRNILLEALKNNAKMIETLQADQRQIYEEALVRIPEMMTKTLTPRQQSTWEEALMMLYTKNAHGLWWEIPDQIEYSALLDRTTPNAIKLHATTIEDDPTGPWNWYGSDVTILGNYSLFLNKMIKERLVRSRIVPAQGPCANVSVSATSKIVERPAKAILGYSFKLYIRVLTLEIRGQFVAEEDAEGQAEQRRNVEAASKESISRTFKQHMQGWPTYFREFREHSEYEYRMDMEFEFND